MKTKEISIVVSFNDLFYFVDSNSTSETEFSKPFGKIIELLKVENNIKQLHQDFLNSNKNWNAGDIIIYTSNKKSKLILDLAIDAEGYDLIYLGCLYDSFIKKEIVTLFRELFDNSTAQIEYVESVGRLENLIKSFDFPKKRKLGNNIEYDQKLVHYVNSNELKKEEISHKINWQDLTQTLDKCQIASVANTGDSKLKILLTKLKIGPIGIIKNLDLIIIRDKSELQNIINTYDSNIRL